MPSKAAARERSIRPSWAATRKVNHTRGMAMTKVTARPRLSATRTVMETPTRRPKGKSRACQASERHSVIPRHGRTKNPITAMASPSGDSGAGTPEWRRRLPGHGRDGLTGMPQSHSRTHEGPCRQPTNPQAQGHWRSTGVSMAAGFPDHACIRTTVAAVNRRGSVEIETRRCQVLRQSETSQEIRERPEQVDGIRPRRCGPGDGARCRGSPPSRTARPRPGGRARSPRPCPR